MSPVDVTLQPFKTYMGVESSQLPRSDQERFTDLFTATYAPVFAYVTRRVCATDAEDIVADVFALAWRNLEKLPEPSLPWLYRAAWNKVGNHRRKAARQAILADRLAAGGQSSKGGDPADEALDGTLGTAMSYLSENDREAIRLVCWEQLSIHDAATVLRCSDTAMKVRLHRARRRLSGHLDREFPETPPTPTALSPCAPLEHRR